MTTLIALTRMMESYSHAVAPESECLAWQKFIEECRCDLHRLPWGDEAENFVPEGFAILEPCRNRREPGFRCEERRLFSRRVTLGEKQKYCPPAPSRRLIPYVLSPAIGASMCRRTGAGIGRRERGDNTKRKARLSGGWPGKVINGRFARLVI